MKKSITDGMAKGLLNRVIVQVKRGWKEVKKKKKSNQLFTKERMTPVIKSKPLFSFPSSCKKIPSMNWKKEICHQTGFWIYQHYLKWEMYLTLCSSPRDLD